jgi:hypothetical protein
MLPRAGIILGSSSVSAILVMALLDAPAYASNFGSQTCGGFPINCVSLANNAGHTYRHQGTLGNQITDMELHVQSAAYGEYDPIAGFSFHYDPADTQPDVWVGDYPYPTWDVYAATWCPSTAYATGGNRSGGTGWCFGQRVEFNSDATTAYDTFNKRQHLACHELGHTIGLRHPTLPSNFATCLNSSLSANISIQTGHDDVHIENAY